jgi:hypothetical protein
MFDDSPDEHFLLPDDRYPAVCLEPDGRCRLDSPRPPLLVCGSFNPLHEGHRQMAQQASERLHLPFAFELSLLNVEKPALEPAEVRRRAAFFRGVAPLWLTRLPTYDAKARVFPGTVFVVGADTARRILEPRFYSQPLHEALEAIRHQGCRFVVAGRVDASGRYVTLADLPVPTRFEKMFLELPGFRCDVSSTALRLANDAREQKREDG